MKRKILSVLGVLMAVLMSTAVLAACEKAPAGAENSGGNGESVSTEQGGEPSVSEGAAESVGSSEADLSTSGAQDNGKLKYGFTPCSYEETLAFIETDEAKEQAASYIEWMGAANFTGENSFVEGDISILLGWFEAEIYAAAGEDSYNEKEQYLLIPAEIAKECLYRHFGVYDFDPSDYFYSPETDSYTIHKEYEGPRYEVISIKFVSVSENVIECENVFSDGYHDEGEPHYLASRTVMKALNDGNKPFLQLIASSGDSDKRFSTPEEAETSLKNQLR